MHDHDSRTSALRRAAEPRSAAPRLGALRTPGERPDRFDLDAARIRRRPALAAVLLPLVERP